MFDRLYGRLVFPKIVRKLLNCPGLLRLREVHMSSVPFMNFPSFYSVTRFEHSLGVCHLAQLASQSLGLSTTDRAELMLACLYHDVATPPFAHVTEEIMNEFFSFDHETYLHNLLIGRTDDPGMERCQIFMRRGLKLAKIIESAEGRRLGLDIFRIADMAVGKGDFGSLVKADIDLDNIDNVIRAATAIGIRDSDSSDAEALAVSFGISNGRIVLPASSIDRLRKWKRTRYTLYDMIYGNIEDFALQTMLKRAIRSLLDTNDSMRKLLPMDWRLTDEELIRDRIMHDDRASRIMDRIILYKPYACVGVFEFSGKESYLLAEDYLSKIEQIAHDFFGVECITNYAVDKRHRTIAKPISQPLARFFGEKQSDLDEETIPSLFVYVFSTGKKGHYYREPDGRFRSKLQQSMPGKTNLKPMKRIMERYPRLVEMEWDQ